MQASATPLSMTREEVKEVLYQMEFKLQHQSEQVCSLSTSSAMATTNRVLCKYISPTVQFIHQARRVPEITEALKLVCTSLIGERQLHQNAKVGCKSGLASACLTSV